MVNLPFYYNNIILITRLTVRKNLSVWLRNQDRTIGMFLLFSDLSSKIETDKQFFILI